MLHQQTSLPHTGIATFCKAPYVPDVTQLDADIAVMGIPYKVSLLTAYCFLFPAYQLAL